ncbi:MAG: DUF3052 domain-containing protein [Micromonosporaceae bacterium]
MVGYSGAPLHRKLGITPESSVLLDGAPPGFDLAASGRAPHRRAGAGPYHVIVCFCPDAARLRRRYPALHGLTTPEGALWIAWPKRSSGVATDLNENLVRDHALGHGRVDVKVCAIDETWSGLKLVIRKADR